MLRRSLAFCLLACLASGSPAFAGLLNKNCLLGAQPAATLLFPYFEVDLDDPAGVTTLISVSNTNPVPQLVHLILWTDWAIPTWTFEVYLAGYDVQTINMRDILVYGRLPRTGAGVSPHHGLSSTPRLFPGCNQGTTPGAAPVYADPALNALQREMLQKQHSGQPIPVFGFCHASPRADPTLATGYVTADVVRRCSTAWPDDNGYFVKGGSGIATDSNAITGDWLIVHPANQAAHGDVAAHVVADASAFKSGDYTFYGSYVGMSARDDRITLGSWSCVRFLNGGVFDGGARVIVWRDTGRPVQNSAIPCGTLPTWAPLSSNGIWVTDEATEATRVADTPRRFPWATQLVDVGDLTEVPFGMLDLSLNSLRIPGHKTQGWVVGILEAPGYSAALPAMRYNENCTNP